MFWLSTSEKIQWFLCCGQTPGSKARDRGTREGALGTVQVGDGWTELVGGCGEAEDCFQTDS